MNMSCGATNLTPAQLTELTQLPADKLADLMESTHHEYIREFGPQLIEMADKLLRVHGEDSALIRQFTPLIHALVEDLTPHLFKEEQILFPAIRNLAQGTSEPTCFGHIGNPIRVMTHEHHEAERIMLALQQLTQHFQAPAEACQTWQRCYQLCAEFCQDLINHIHVEDTILFPTAIELAE
ncbi:hemerythrin domain-containing protein [Vibrio aphrogenes]|uniref:hemerythrin domain-containing protein n=1 Tax=Vibrio aphrogenes TaxID=1891186 RepID=UPI000B3621BD|nr:hemerythrin domain-containing protein [Vibrio aphrogenes]